MKKFLILPVLLIVLASCKPTRYVGNFGQISQTQVVLSEANFNNLGNFTGMATEKTNKANIRDQQGLVALARQDFLKKANAAGVTLNGSRTLINVSVDVVKNMKRVTVSFTADIIEFK
ncbi:MAG: hypothetical protein GQ574_19310 [Crocinitomix sp.]|nr:hypothetical protein [Crocinitomix sp.]